MPWDLIALCSALADLYPTRGDVVRAAVEAGLDQRFINLTGRPIAVWNAVLQEAKRRAMERAVIEYALCERPDDPVLRAALARLPPTPAPGVPAMSLPPPGTPVPAIDGPARKELRLALLEAFPQPSELAMLVEETLGVPFVNITLANDMPTRAFDLIGWAKARGRLTELVAGAAAERPKSGRLQTFAGRLTFPDKTDGQDERIVRQDVPFQNPAEWAVRFARCRATVARIEPQPLAQSDEGFGTGFLVGPDLLLTNYHIIDSGVFHPEKVVVRFDCEYGPDGRETLGRPCKLAAAWKVSGSVRVKDGGLDFALVRLAEKAADDAAPAGKRGWLGLKPHAFKTGQPLFILQHPAARPMQLAIGTVTGVAPSPVQVGYDVSTLGGSSGSPCLNSALELVALHHWGTDDHNRGVTATALRADPTLQALTPPAA